MAVDAYILPYAGRSVGVVFWAPRRADTRRRRSSSAPDTLAIYSPAALSPGEVAELHDRLVGDLGQTFGDDRAVAGGRLLWLWWLGGVIVVIILALRALLLGPGFAWLVLLPLVMSLPVLAGGVLLPAWARRAGRARRLVRRVGALEPAPGTDPRLQERLDGLWRLARRLAGPPLEQVRDLEAYCHEHAWREAAAFYAAHRPSQIRPVSLAGRIVAWRRRWTRRLAGDARPPYTLLELRAL